MGKLTHAGLALALAGTVGLCLVAQAAAPGTEEDAIARAARWVELQKLYFPTHTLEDGTGIVDLIAPQRAPDAALVPVELQFKGQVEPKGVYLVIDENPAPLAAHFTFGPEADPHSVKLRVRVDQYTSMHAVLETADGRFFVTERYVKAAGGCSAPPGTDEAEAASVGAMRLRLLNDFSPGQTMVAQLMIRHPNFNGMQMDQVKRTFTPPRFIQGIDASFEGRPIFHLDSDIAMSTDPVITFGFVPKAKGTIEVVVRDTADATFQRRFPVPES